MTIWHKFVFYYINKEEANQTVSAANKSTTIRLNFVLRCYNDMKKIFGSFKSINIITLLVTIVLTIAYPVAKALISSANRLMIFSDTLLIISLILIAVGILFTFARYGDFDITGYIFHRGISKNAKSYENYKKDLEANRRETFNYPLLLGLIYLIISLTISFVLC